VDTDGLVEERWGVPISDIVESHGWDHFRTLEKRVIGEISRQDHLVIAPGGGALLDADNAVALKRNGLIIWLKADLKVLRNRMEGDPRTSSGRPTLTGKGALEELKEVMHARIPFYKKAAEIELDTSSLDVEEVVEALILILKERIGGS